MIGRVLSLVAAVVAISCAMGSPASANLLVNLTTVELTPANHVHDIAILNSDDQPHILETNVIVWGQGEDGSISSQPTNDIVLSPKLVTIPPHAQQIVRVFARAPIVDDVERAYRVDLSEIAPKGTGRIAIGVNQSYGIYVFTRPPASTRPAVSAAIVRTEPGHARLTLANDGSTHALVGLVKIVAGGREVFTGRPIAFVLGRSTRSAIIAIPGDSALESPTVRLEVDGRARIATR